MKKYEAFLITSTNVRIGPETIYWIDPQENKQICQFRDIGTDEYPDHEIIDIEVYQNYEKVNVPVRCGLPLWTNGGDITLKFGDWEN